MYSFADYLHYNYIYIIALKPQPISILPALSSISHPPATRPQDIRSQPPPVHSPSRPSRVPVPHACERPPTRRRPCGQAGGECPKANLEELLPIELTEDPREQNRKYQWLNKQANSSSASLKTIKRPSAKSTSPSRMPSMNSLPASESAFAGSTTGVIISLTFGLSEQTD